MTAEPGDSLVIGHNPACHATLPPASSGQPQRAHVFFADQTGWLEAPDPHDDLRLDGRPIRRVQFSTHLNALRNGASSAIRSPRLLGVLELADERLLLGADRDEKGSISIRYCIDTVSIQYRYSTGPLTVEVGRASSEAIRVPQRWHDLC